jgi:modulator of FtsH protease HflC
MKRVMVPVVLIGLGLTAWSAFFAVDVTQHAIVTRFGNPMRVIVEPGLQVKWPAPIERVVRFDNRLLVFDMPGPNEPAKEFLTLDKKNVEVSSYTCWRIRDPRHFLETVGTREDVEARLGDVVIAELGKVLGQHNLSGLLSTNSAELKLEPIMQQIRTACAAKAIQEYGVEIVDFRIKRVNFPEQNRGSVFERMRAERNRMATRYRSEGEEEATKIRAEADKKRTEILAEAYRKAQEIQGKAEAEATRIYAEAYGQDPEFYEFLRTLESYEKSLTSGTTIVLPADSPYLKLLKGALTGQAPKAPSVAQAGQAPPANSPPKTEKPGEPRQQ